MKTPPETSSEAAAIWTDIDTLIPWEDNPRINDHAVEDLVRSIKRFGFSSPIVARSNGELIAGHTRLKAALKLGLKRVPVRFLDLDPVEAHLLAIADNKLGEIADWSDDDLGRILSEMKHDEVDLTGIGFNDEQIDELISQFEAPEVPEEPAGEASSEDQNFHDWLPDEVEPITKPGEVITLGRHTLYCDDCLTRLKSLPDNSIDSIVTDPPYGIGFMSKAWDCSVPSEDWASECLRVLKPGGHLIAFAATRTIHRLMVSVEDAGFEIRDLIAWCYFSGFPKSLDVSKAIDKHFGAEREVVGIKKGVRGADGTGHEQSMPGKAIGIKQTSIDIPITSPATSEAKEHQGTGTALKPAFEPCVLARKPLSEKSVALNVLRWGTGGIRIDDCRFAYGDPCWVGPQNDHTKDWKGDRRGFGSDYVGGVDGSIFERHNYKPSQGRWPANLYQCPKASRSEREKGCVPTEGKIGYGKGIGRATVEEREEIPLRPKTFEGSSRPSGQLFRGKGGDEVDPVQQDISLRPSSGADAVDRKEGSDGLNSPRAGASRTAKEVYNIHPTVKPVKLMRWLVRLVTPRQGTVLETFCGSGTTMIASELEDLTCIGIEREPQYCDIIRVRLSHHIRTNAKKEEATEDEEV